MRLFTKKKKKEKKSHVDKATEGNNTDKALSVPAHSTTLLHPGPPFASSPQGSTNFNFTPTLSSCPPASHWTAWRFVFSFISFSATHLQQRDKIKEKRNQTHTTTILFSLPTLLDLGDTSDISSIGKPIGENQGSRQLLRFFAEDHPCTILHHKGALRGGTGTDTGRAQHLDHISTLSNKIWIKTEALSSNATSLNPFFRRCRTQNTNITRRGARQSRRSRSAQRRPRRPRYAYRSINRKCLLLFILLSYCQVINPIYVRLNDNVADRSFSLFHSCGLFLVI